MFIAEEHGKVVENVKRLRSLVTSQRESKSPDEFLADNCDKTHRLTILAASEARRKPLVFAEDALSITLYIESECHLRRFLAWAYRRRRGNKKPRLIRRKRGHKKAPEMTALAGRLPSCKLLGKIEEEGTIRLRHSFHVSLEL